MNALQMVNELLSRFGLKEVSAINQTSDSIIAFRKINLAIQQIVTAYPFSWLEVQTPYDFNAIEGSGFYTLPTAIRNIIVVRHTYQNGGFLKLVDRSTLEQIRPVRSDADQRGVPAYLATGGKFQTSDSSDGQWQIEVWPRPSADFAGSSISVYYIRNLPDLVAATDVSLVPSSYHNVIVDTGEVLFRRGPLRVGGDQNQLNIYQACVNAMNDGIRKMIVDDSPQAGPEVTWEPDTIGL